MRIGLTVVLGLAAATSLLAQGDKQPPQRYGIDASLDVYPQDSPKAALQSVVKAIDNKQIEYLLAQLSDPEFVDDRVKRVHAGKFEELVQETTQKLNRDPGSVKQLRRFLAEGEWDADEARASAKLKDVREQVFLRKLQGRWFLENRNTAKAK